MMCRFESSVFDIADALTVTVTGNRETDAMSFGTFRLG
jgi:hypothetical protein